MLYKELTIIHALNSVNPGSYEYIDLLASLDQYDELDLFLKNEYYYSGLVIEKIYSSRIMIIFDSHGFIFKDARIIDFDDYIKYAGIDGQGLIEMLYYGNFTVDSESAVQKVISSLEQKDLFYMLQDNNMALPFIHIHNRPIKLLSNLVKHNEYKLSLAIQQDLLESLKADREMIIKVRESCNIKTNSKHSWKYIRNGAQRFVTKPSCKILLVDSKKESKLYLASLVRNVAGSIICLQRGHKLFLELFEFSYEGDILNGFIGPYEMFKDISPTNFWRDDCYINTFSGCNIVFDVISRRIVWNPYYIHPQKYVVAEKHRNLYNYTNRLCALLRGFEDILIILAAW